MEIFLYSFINHAYLKGLIGEVYILNSLEEKQTNIYTILSVECGSGRFMGGGGRTEGQIGRAPGRERVAVLG